jgi:PAS domain S-box-containing protein
MKPQPAPNPPPGARTPRRGAARRRALPKTGALQRAILDSTSFSSIATDERGVIQVFNAGAERMLGLAAAEVVNRHTPADLSDPVEQQQRAAYLSGEFGTAIAPGVEAMTYKAARGIEDIHELTWLRGDGGRLPALVSITALRDAQQQVIGYLLVATDNTLRQRAEAERQRLDLALRETNVALHAARVAADSANHAKSQFLSNMSHELRSPLNAILGFAQLMESAEPPPAPAQQDSIAQILQAGWYLLELINEILDLALIESGRLSLSTEPTLLAETIGECVAMIEPQARRGGIRIGFAAPAGPVFVKADRTRLKQVFVNLLSNGIKYNRVGGSVDVSVRGTGDGRVRVSFQDTGAGLPPEQLAQLFEPFNRLGQEAGEEEGTGIGLVVSKRLVELMGGCIGVESSPGVGSVFWVDIDEAPAVESASDDVLPLPAPAEVHSAGLPQRTVLCVEDNPTNLLLVARLLARRPDLRLLGAKDGRRGVELAHAARPDVILMDINLPGISGFTALQMLAGNPATAHIPVVALSANAMPRDVEKGLAAGFFRYLTKPIKVDEFMATLDLALETAARTGAPA